MIRITELFFAVKELCMLSSALLKARKTKKKVYKNDLYRLEDRVDDVIAYNRAVHRIADESCMLLMHTYLHVAANINTPIGDYLLEIFEDEAYIILENLRRFYPNNSIDD